MRGLWIGLLAAGCVEPSLEPIEGTQVMWDLGAAAEGGEHFFDAPYPMNLRLREDGAPPATDMMGLTHRDLVTDLATLAEDRRGYPTMSVGWFRFDGPVGTLTDEPMLFSGGADDPIGLLNVDVSGGGSWVPVVAQRIPEDAYVPSNVVGVAPVPGWVLQPGATYAYVVRRSLGDASGEPLGVPLAVRAPMNQQWAQTEALRRAQLGLAEDEPHDLARLKTHVATLRGAVGRDVDSVAAFSLFTTGDVVAETAALSEQVVERYALVIEGLELQPERGADHPNVCELVGTLELPQFQQGEPPFDTEGLFQFDGDQLVEQRSTSIPVVIALPKEPMPDEGYPLTLYFHGSGGLSDQLIARGPMTETDGEWAMGYGPAYVLARHGIASAGSAHPVNPERVPGASEQEYLNFANLPAFRDTFRQGILEQRLYLDALLDLRIPDRVLEGCEGPDLPDGEQQFFFDPSAVTAMGQSMGGMYTNMIGAVEPDITAVVPTGAGGHWSRFILETELLGEGVTAAAMQAMLGTDVELTHLHPALHMAQTAWEPAEPMVYTPRLARKPLPGHPRRPIYQPVGRGDSYFPTPILDAIALAYGNEMAGEEVWPEMRELLALQGRGEILEYPVFDNRRGSGGEKYTGVVVQYEGDGFSDPHSIYAQLEEVKHQYGCFLRSFLDDGVAVVPAPAPLDTPCP